MPNLSRAAQQTTDNLLNLGKAVQSGSLLAESKEITPIQAKALKMIKVAVVRNESEEGSSLDAEHVVFTRRPAFVASFLYGFLDAVSPMGHEFMVQAIGPAMTLLKKAGTAKGEAASEEKVMAEVIARTLGQVKSWKPSLSQKDVLENKKSPFDETGEVSGFTDHIRRALNKSARELEKLTEGMLKDIEKSEQAVGSIEMMVEGVPGEILAGEWIPLPVSGVRITPARLGRIVAKLSRRGVGYTKAMVILNAIIAASNKNA
jgi:DNA-binding MarR family transcriptional regulator